VWWLGGIAVGIAAAWLSLVAVLYLRHPNEATVRGALRLLPDTIRLVRRLATDARVPRRSRALLWILLGYLVSPIDFVPDFLPVVGYADDAILVGLVLRHVVRRAGAHLVSEQWPGTKEGLEAVLALAGLAREQ
jgi:uncharacterized membrane protein YkvA (DUF1232 family)